MKTGNKILVICAFTATFMSLALGTLSTLGFGIRPSGAVAGVLTAASFTVMMAAAINWAYKAGGTNGKERRKL
jgi:hypothetical protein